MFLALNLMSCCPSFRKNFNHYAIYHDYECDDYPPRDPYDGDPSDAPSTDWWVASLGYYWLEATTTAITK